MPQTFVHGALSMDRAVRLDQSRNRHNKRVVVFENIVPQRMLFVLPTEQPVEHSVTDGRANVGHGHKPFASGASVFQL